MQVFGVDKFPRMTDYVVPTGVRIADADRVRLGAHLAEGTTVMHEGFVNYNAGTLGASMVEGRISAGVVVGDGSDIGGGASIMGTLSGGGKEQITVGAALPDRRQRRHRHIARRRLRRRGRHLRHRRLEADAARRPRRQGRRRCPASPACSSGATASPALSRHARAPAAGIALNDALHANDVSHGLRARRVGRRSCVLVARGPRRRRPRRPRALVDGQATARLRHCTSAAYELDPDQAVGRGAMVGAVTTYRPSAARAGRRARARRRPAGEQAAQPRARRRRPRLGRGAAAAPVAGLGQASGQSRHRCKRLRGDQEFLDRARQDPRTGRR